MVSNGELSILVAGGVLDPGETSPSDSTTAVSYILVFKAHLLCSMHQSKITCVFLSLMMAESLFRPVWAALDRKYRHIFITWARFRFLQQLKFPSMSICSRVIRLSVSAGFCHWSKKFMVLRDTSP